LTQHSLLSTIFKGDRRYSTQPWRVADDRRQAARADLLRRTNQREAAADAYERALALCGNSPERAYLQRRLDEMLNLRRAGRICDIIGLCHILK
jgi:hypothetical protein